MMKSGLQFPLAAPAATLALDAEFVVQEAKEIWIQVSPYYICLCADGNYSSIGKTVGVNIVSHTRDFSITSGAVTRLSVTYDQGRISVRLNAERLDFESEYAPTIDAVEITWPEGCAVKRLDLQVEQVHKQANVRLAEDFRFYSTIDWYDDILSAPYNRDMLVALMANYAAMGIKRLYWIYWSDQKAGFYDPSGNRFGPDQSIADTFAAFPEGLDQAVVRAAHDVGIEIFAVFKPFDMSLHFAGKYY